MYLNFNLYVDKGVNWALISLKINLKNLFKNAPIFF